MNIFEINEKFEKVGCLTFATIDNGYPETRIAHFVACDEEGLYFMTMKVKPFYRQVKESGKVSACGMSASTNVAEDENGMPVFEPGYTIRVTGDVKEVSFDELKKKAEKNDDFISCVKDIERYNNMTTFCLYRGKGEIFDYDFEMQSRENKIYREKFSFGGFETKFRGMKINSNCIGCGKCQRSCTFKAINKKEDGTYEINSNRCDVCGSCQMVCPSKAIEVYNE